MSRPCSAVARVLLLLLGLAVHGTAQAPSRTLWTLASGEFTIYGHTDYTPTIILTPRIVYDTGHGVDSARVVDSVRMAVSTPTGLAAGLSAWPSERYCAGPASAATQAFDPRALLEAVQHAARCGFRLVIVPPRRLVTINAQPAGIFSLDSAKRLIDRYAAVLPADTLRKYRATIIGMNLGDDYACEACWGGKAITQAQVAAWAAYARSKLPGLPLGVRVTPDWVQAYPALAPLLDYAWAQYHTRKGDPQAYYDRAATIAQQLGLRMIMGVNVENCYGQATDACTAADLLRFGTMAVTHPASCAFLSWRYAETTWQRAEIRSAWDELLALARARPAQECRRAAA